MIGELRRLASLIAVLLPLLGPALAPPSAAAVTEQKGSVRVGLTASIAPRRLPRHGLAPVSVSISTQIAGTGGSAPPQLGRLRIEINREGRLEAPGLPLCRYREIQPASSTRALAACRGALVGRGHLAANVVLPQLTPFPSSGEVLAFNGRYQGKPAILAHVYGTKPFPTSYTLPFVITRAKGRFGTVLTASLPQVTGEWGYLTGLSLKIGRTYRYGGRRHGYLSAGCPAPAGFPSVSFPLARAGFDFVHGPSMLVTVSSTCKASG